MKLLIVYLYCTQGGVETAIKNRIQNVDLKKDSIDLLFMYDYGGRKVFDDLGLNLIIENRNEKIKEIILRNKYDLVISFDTFEIVQVLQDIDYTGKIGLEVHTTYQDSLVYLKEIKDGMIDYITVPSEYEKELVSKRIKVDIPIYILPNALDFSIFKEVKFTKVYDKPILLFVGRVDEHKNWRMFLEIVKEVNRITNNHFEAWIVGGLRSEVKQLEAMRKKILEDNLVSNFRWIPYIEYKRMNRMYSYVGQSGGALVITSKNESFGMTVLEAMACKCPVIANKVGAINELIVDNTYGCLIDCKKDSINDMANNLLDFINENRQSDLKENAYSFVNENFSTQSISNKFLNQITEVVCFTTNT